MYFQKFIQDTIQIDKQYFTPTNKFTVSGYKATNYHE